MKLRTAWRAALAVLALLLPALRGLRPELREARGAADALIVEPQPAELAPPGAPPSSIHADATTTSPTTDDPTSFEGRVASAADGGGVIGAELTFALGSAAATVRADATGAFRFAPPVPGLWTLAAANAPGFLPFAPEWATSPVVLAAQPGARVRGIEIVLRPAVTYRGEVLDSADRPVVGAEVRVQGAAAGDTALLPLRERYVTGPDGDCVFVAPDGARLEARAEGFAPGHAEIDLAARASRLVRIRLRSGPAAAAAESIAGAVVQHGSGAPVAGALVTATPSGADAPAKQAVTDAAGAFSLQDLPAGAYRLEARATGLASVRRWGVRAGSRDVVLHLAPGGAITGRVRDRQTGAPVAPFVVSVYMPDGPLQPLRTEAVIEAEGRFEVTGVPPGPALVVISSPAHAPSPGAPVVVAEVGAPPHVDVELGAGGAVEGTVLDCVSGDPIAGAEVEADGLRVESAGVLPVRQRARSGTDGRFRLAGLPEGGASLLVRAARYHTRIVRGLAVREAETAGSIVRLSPIRPGDEPRTDPADVAPLDTPGVLAQR